jgi:hypothetical protein
MNNLVLLHFVVVPDAVLKLAQIDRFATTYGDSDNGWMGSGEGSGDFDGQVEANRRWFRP